MDERNLSWLLAAAQARVRATSALLALPRECHVDECVTLLREAQGYLEWLLDRMRSDQPAPAELRAQAAELAGEMWQG